MCFSYFLNYKIANQNEIHTAKNSLFLINDEEMKYRGTVM